MNEKRGESDRSRVFIARLFLVLGGAAGLILVFCIPPLQAPDEPAHFYRSYQISEGTFFPIVDGIHSGGYLPESLPLFVSEISGDIPFHPEKKIRLQAILSGFRQPLNPGRRIFTAFPNTVIYSPIPYLAQAFGIALGRAVSGPPIALMYWGRCLNLLMFLLLVAGAIRRTSIAPWLFFFLGLMPMTIFQAATLSSDAFTNGIGFLFIALLLRSRTRETYMSWTELLSVAAPAVLLMLSKPGYAPMLLLFLLLPRRRFPSSRRYWLSVILSPLIALALAVAWGWLVHSARLPLPGVSKQSQLTYIMNHPLRIMHIIADMLKYRTPIYLITFVGKLGWVDVSLSNLFIKSYLIVLLTVSILNFGNETNLGVFHRLLAALVFILNTISLLLMLYLWWNPVGHATIEGMQGRYLIPCAPAAFLIWHFRRPDLTRYRRAISVLFAAYAVFSLGYTIFSVVMRYYFPVGA